MQNSTLAQLNQHTCIHRDIMDKKDNLKRLIIHVKVSKKIERSEIENSRVNYVCNVDVIT